MSKIAFKHRDMVELHPNDVFKNRPFQVIMTTKDQVMIDISVEGRHITAIIHPDMVAKVTPIEEYERVSAEHEPVQMILDKHLFNRFDH